MRFFPLVAAALLLTACEEEDDAVAAPLDPVGSWSLVQTVETDPSGQSTYTDFPQLLDTDLQWVFYDIAEDGTYDATVLTEHIDGSVSVDRDPDTLTWSSTGDRSLRLLVSDGDPVVELDCHADEGQDNVMNCVVDAVFSDGSSPPNFTSVTLERA